MSNDTNVVVLIGRLTRDAELKFTNSGLAIVRFSVASNRSIKRGDTWEKEVDYYDITSFGKQGEAVAQYLTKGTQVAIQGELRQDRWEKDGQKHSKVAIVANNIQLLGGKKQETQPSGQPEQSSVPEQFEDDIPF